MKWPWKKEYERAEITPGKVTETEDTVVITERSRGPVDAAKVETLVWLLSKVANEDLDAMFVVVLQECRDLGYNLVDDPKALLERLKRQF